MLWWVWSAVCGVNVIHMLIIVFGVFLLPELLKWHSFEYYRTRWLWMVGWLWMALTNIIVIQNVSPSLFKVTPWFKDTPLYSSSVHFTVKIYRVRYLLVVSWNVRYCLSVDVPEWKMYFVWCFSDAVRPHEALDVANVMFSIVTYCPLRVLTELPSDVMTEFISCLSRLTCHFCRASADENVRCYKILCIFGFNVCPVCLVLLHI